MILISLSLSLSLFAPQSVDEKSSPFDGLRWSGDQPEVQIEATWYTPIAIDRVAVDEILARCDQWSPGRIKRFAEDLVPVMQSLGWNGDAFVDLDLLTLTDGSKVRIENVEMTRGKRQALHAQRSARESSGSRSSSRSSQISVKDVYSDIEAFGASLKDQFAYLGLGKVNLDDELSRIREGFSGEHASINDLAQDLHKLLMRYGDGHARVESNRPQGQPGDKFLPFLLVESSVGVVAVLTDRSALVDEGAPVVRAIDGRPLGDWVEAMKPFVTKGSTQLILRRSLGNLREIDGARRLLGLETGGPLDVTFTTGDGSRTVQRELTASSNRPTYGTWPRPESSIPNALLEGNIGYLRIPKMNDDVELVHAAMRSFADTEGLIVDVRGNGGGTRALLLALGGYLIDPKRPAVVANIAKYRLSQKFSADHLEARYMYRADWSGWSKRQQSAIRESKSNFKPEWRPVGEFSDWHYLVLDRTDYPGEYFYDRQVVVLSDSGCFSATDIFLGALEILPSVTLVGTASSGGSARSQSFRLPKTGIEVRCASMASFRPDGRLYDGRGIEVDIEIPSDPTDFLMNGADVQLKAALAHLGVSHQENEAELAKITLSQAEERLDFWVGEWTSVDKKTKEIIEKFDIRWKVKGSSLEGEVASFQGGKLMRSFFFDSYYDPGLETIVEEYRNSKKELPFRVQYLHWKTMSSGDLKVINLPLGVKVEGSVDITGPDSADLVVSVFENGDLVFNLEAVMTRVGPSEDSQNS